MQVHDFSSQVSRHFRGLFEDQRIKNRHVHTSRHAGPGAQAYGTTETVQALSTIVEIDVKRMEIVNGTKPGFRVLAEVVSHSSCLFDPAFE